MNNQTHKFSLVSDEELMHHLYNGEADAFDELYNRYGKRLQAYFVRMLNFDKTLAQDALQDLFLKIAEAPEKFDTSRSFKTWIFSVASNSCKNYYRQKNKVLQSNEELNYLNNQHNDSTFYTSASKIDAITFRNMLGDCLNELPLEKKEAFILKYQEEKTIAEIAIIQGCPEGSVKSRLHYTIKVLEEKLKIFNPIN